MRVAAILEEVTLLAAVLTFVTPEFDAGRGRVVTFDVAEGTPHGTRRLLRLGAAALVRRVPLGAACCAHDVAEAILGEVTYALARLARGVATDILRVTILAASITLGRRAHAIGVPLEMACPTTDVGASIDRVTHVGLVVVAPHGLLRRRRDRLLLDILALLLLLAQLNRLANVLKEGRKVGVGRRLLGSHDNRLANLLLDQTPAKNLPAVEDELATNSHDLENGSLGNKESSRHFLVFVFVRETIMPSRS